MFSGAVELAHIMWTKLEVCYPHVLLIPPYIMAINGTNFKIMNKSHTRSYSLKLICTHYNFRKWILEII